MKEEVMAIQEDDLLTFDEALQILGTSRATLYRLLGQGEVKGLKVGKQWRFRRVDLVAYVQRSPVAIAAAPSADLASEMDYFEGELRANGHEVPDRPEASEDKTAALLESLWKHAIDRRVSDIHIDPVTLDGVACVWVRFRIDGVLNEIRRMPATLHDAIMAQLKTSAGMDPVEKRAPQNGRIRYGDFDLRAAVVPGFAGEMATLRIMRRSSVLVGLDQLGILGTDRDRLLDLLRQPNGIILITGPSGSGKTTTLYSCLHRIAQPGKKTISIENPVEYEIPFVNQIQLSERSGQTFTAAIRACLRLDPDILYIAEEGTGSLETLRSMAETSLNGHLILTNMACNDGPSAIARLIDVGLEPYLIPATVIGILSQRLCRRICPSCKESYNVPASDLARFGFSPPDPAETVTLYRGRGCDECSGRSFRGRVGLYELLTMNEEIGELIVGRAPMTAIRAAARAGGMKDLREDGLEKVLAGLTTPDEVMRVLFTVAA